MYEIASHLNKAFALPSALTSALEKTVEILGVDTGWIWLTEPNNKSVYLAASYQLPPALSNHPERLSGPCYCIKKYLSDDIEKAENVSEIKCTRLENLTTDTQGLKFHATIPIKIGNQKVGLMNLLTNESRKLDEYELTVLNTISELIGAAIERTRLQHSNQKGKTHSTENLQSIISRVFTPKMESIISILESGNEHEKALIQLLELKQELNSLTQEIKENHVNQSELELHYPEMPLTKREMEVFKRIRQGLTNVQIGEQLYITERTVKFHVTSILSKLHAKTRTEAVDVGLKRGLWQI